MEDRRLLAVLEYEKLVARFLRMTARQGQTLQCCVWLEARSRSEFCKTWGRVGETQQHEATRKAALRPQGGVRQVLGEVKCFKWGGCD